MASEYPDRARLAGVFADPDVADAYRHRPPYPTEVFAILDRLIRDRPRTVLDLGAGEGALARPLAARVDRVDAVDPSEAMVAAGRSRPGGAVATLRWVVDAAETCPLDGPYALVTAGASLHWMRWGPLCARLVPALSAHAYLAVVEHGPREVPWGPELVAVIRRYSRSPRFDPRFSVVEALAAAGLVEPAGTATTAPVRFDQPVADYVEQFHSTASLARLHLSAAEAAEFDAAVTRLVRPWAVDGRLELAVDATVSWGRLRSP
jgi:SAM-dependent methyltransferase